MHIEEFSKKGVVASGINYDHLIYVRLFEGCNLYCEHCYIPSNPKKISLSFYEDMGLTKELIKHAMIKDGDSLYLQWHGGEPTLLGVKYLEKAIGEVEKDKRFIYQHGIQTNLMNFLENSTEWIGLYKKHFNGEIGVSWDFGIRHYKKDVYGNLSNVEFENIFWKNVSVAQLSDLKLYMVVTATKVFFEKFKNPFDFFEFISSRGIKYLNFERITKTGIARDTWDKLGLSNKEYSNYMSKFFKAYVSFKDLNPEIKLNISPFDGLLGSVVGLLKGSVEVVVPSRDDMLSYKNQGYGCWSGQCDTRFHTIDASGYKHGCTALTSEQDNSNKSLGKSLDGKKIMWVGKNNLEQKRNILLEREDRQKSCVGCEFLKICSSGCLSVGKFDESGECSGAKSLFSTIKNTANLFLKVNHD